MITGSQIRAARSALKWSIEDLSHRSEVGVRTIKRFEAVNGIPPSRSSTLNDVKMALEAAGIEFIGSPTDRPGIRLGTQVRVSNTSNRRQRS
jgi:ribosome-binding protein aMBF1 (putative translation factor)